MFQGIPTGQRVAFVRIVRRFRMLFLLFVVLASVPSMVAAVTLDQVLALKKAGVTDAVVLALIERDHAVFTIQPEQIVVLQHEGLSEPLIIAMLKSGQAADEAARAESAYASAMIAAAIAPGPQVLIVGHGPERPNTPHRDGFWTRPRIYSPLIDMPYDSPFTVPFDTPYAMPYAMPRVIPRAERFVQPRALCYAQVNTSATRSNALPFVTE